MKRVMIQRNLWLVMLALLASACTTTDDDLPHPENQPDVTEQPELQPKGKAVETQYEPEPLITTCDDFRVVNERAARTFLAAVIADHLAADSNLPSHLVDLALEGSESLDAPADHLAYLCLNNDSERFKSAMSDFLEAGTEPDLGQLDDLDAFELARTVDLSDDERLYLQIFGLETCSETRYVTQEMARYILLRLLDRQHLFATAHTLTSRERSLVRQAISTRSTIVNDLAQLCRSNSLDLFKTVVGAQVLGLQMNEDARRRFVLDFTPIVRAAEEAEREAERKAESRRIEEERRQSEAARRLIPPMRVRLHDTDSCRQFIDWPHDQAAALAEGLFYALELITRATHQNTLEELRSAGRLSGQAVRDMCQRAGAGQFSYFQWLSSMAIDAFADRDANRPLITERVVTCSDWNALPDYYRWEFEWVYEIACTQTADRATVHQVHVSSNTAAYILAHLNEGVNEAVGQSYAAPMIVWRDDLGDLGNPPHDDIHVAGAADKVEGIIYLNSESYTQDRIALFILLHEAAHIFHYRFFAEVWGYDHNAQGHGPNFRWMQTGLYPKILYYLTSEEGCEIAGRMGLGMAPEACG